MNAQPLLAESQYQEGTTYLYHQYLESQKAIARLGTHAQQLQAANESLAKQLKDVQDELTKLKVPPQQAEPLPVIEHVADVDEALTP